MFACACGYHSPGSSPRDYLPSTLFPNLKLKKDPAISDPETNTSLDFYYTHQGGRPSMKWVKGKSWSKSFMGQKGGKQPERKMYLRTLANLTSPVTQQLFMLQLQRLALRNNLKIIVTSHSPVVLDSVPIEARVFLERTDGNVIVKPAYRDIIQKAFYGQSLEKLSILCEDDMGEGFLTGVLDYLNPKIGLAHDDVVIGRDTGKDQFAMHIEAIGKFR